jgi:flavorubredoxin
MEPVNIIEGVFSVGVQDPNLRIFDIVMTTEYGTTYMPFWSKDRRKQPLLKALRRSFSMNTLKTYKR